MPRMKAPDSGVKVRMYRQGHGDCFLLVFRDDDGKPFYLLIDCGYLPGSEVGPKIEQIVDDIGESTGNHIHVVLITHEHQDHINGFRSPHGKEYFEDIAVDRLWLAWTEDPDDELANKLRQEHHDTLLGLMAASDRLAAAGDAAAGLRGKRVENLLQFEIEGDREMFRALLAVEGITNKRAIQYVKNKTGRNPLYLEPHGQANWLPNVSGLNVYALGPPRDEELLASNDPEGKEGYKKFAVSDTGGLSFLAAALDGAAGDRRDAAGEANKPFAPRYRLSPDEARRVPYGGLIPERYEAEENSWRRIDHDWLRTAENLALRLNTGVNNTCLVVAIELPNTKKVLLFPGDAQRGNWVSWDDGTWINRDGDEVVAKDLLGRCVFYKVGHHGSHNATLKGYAGSDFPNLNWMARGAYRDDYVAAIPAHPGWALESRGWTHPLPSIQDAVNRKARGRVFRTDVDHVTKKYGITDAEWERFQGRITETDLYFEYEIPDEV